MASEVIDLTLDSPPPRHDLEPSRRSSRRKERRQKQEADKQAEPSERKRRHESSPERRHSKREERDSRRSKIDRDATNQWDEQNDRRRRDSSRDRSDRKRSRRKEREREPNPLAPVPSEQLFFIDDKPAQLPSTESHAPVPAPSPAKEESSGLILPAHVSVFGETPNVILPASEPDSDEEDYIEYLDYDNRKDFVRYYDEQTQEKRTKTVCKKCGEEGGHTTFECTVLICQTCGARDEHPTRSCTISKLCFTCGMRGHINSNCPNRNSNNRHAQSGCDRCNSSSHQTRECPKLWRDYAYVEQAEHEHILRKRRDKKGLPLGQGGEGYISDQPWCYNCGRPGHWGDDCQSYCPDPLVEYTAFSHHTLSEGPFTAPQLTDGSPEPPEWGYENIPLPGGVESVGRQGRKKEKERLTRSVQQEEDDPEDWFQRSRDVQIRGASDRERAGKLPTGPRRMHSSSSQERSRPLSSKMSLADRLADPIPERYHDRSHSSRSRDHHSRDRDSAHDRLRNRDSRDHTSHDRSSGHSRHQDREREGGRGPRYKGGYLR